MSRSDITIPQDLSDSVERWFGERGRRWLGDLPATAAALAERWELRLGAPYSGGTRALVLRATAAEGAAAVLKIPIRDDEDHAEADALRVYDGDGAVRLLAYDEQTGALLLERAEPGSPLAGHPDPAAAIEIACRLLRRLRRPAPPGSEFASVVALAERWADELPQRQRRLRLPNADGLVAEAVDLARRYAAAPDGPPLLINQEAHLGDMVRAQRGRWLLIDPAPLTGEAAFEAGYPVLKMLAATMSPGERERDAAAGVVASWAIGLGVDPARVRGWALVRATRDALRTAGAGGNPSAELDHAAALAS